MCEVLTIETNCSGYGLNAEYEFMIWPHKPVVKQPIRCERHGRAGAQSPVMVEDPLNDCTDLQSTYRGEKYHQANKEPTTRTEMCGGCF